MLKGWKKSNALPALVLLVFDAGSMREFVHRILLSASDDHFLFASFYSHFFEDHRKSIKQSVHVEFR
ncbi:MAG: hypothetical protein AB1813_29250, partial [Verrucomicrobiota bacterium]